MSIYLIGDIHGKIEEYYNLIKNNNFNSSIQLGDFGIGFGNDEKIYSYLDNLNKNNISHWFIRGNHDNPNKCQLFSNYLGDWGYLEDQDIFYIGGAYSIDKWARTPNSDWWINEELFQEQWDELKKIYINIKPKYVISHDCPSMIYNKLFHYINIDFSITARELNGLFFHHQPDAWVFGHHHHDVSDIFEDCEFVCLSELSYYNLDVPSLVR